MFDFKQKERFLEKMENMEKYIRILKNHPLFLGLEEDEIKIILKCVEAVTMTKKSGEYILRMGDTTENMGFVLSGTVMVLQEDIWGHRNIMARICAGDIFAEPFAAAPGSVLNVSVMAEKDCEILLLHVGRLLSTCQSACGFHNKLIRNLVSILATKTMTFNEKITHISKRTTREKLLSFLSSEAIRRGSRSFDIAFNRQQLADYLCVERAAMSVELSKLQKEKILTYRKNHFELVYTEELQMKADVFS